MASTDSVASAPSVGSLAAVTSVPSLPSVLVLPSVLASAVLGLVGVAGYCRPSTAAWVVVALSRIWAWSMPIFPVRNQVRVAGRLLRSPVARVDIRRALAPLMP
ncbi:hypothetical protein [Occultella kanbiaonis]|uniref:hypothetical protein n=1 Tax=Occultella kanbiaonis TaxID=2675754 RepID=UPI00143CE861|nr:hypothetical protein [Occultella kanbiaonis]